MKSKVYFSDMRTYGKTNLPNKLKKLLKVSGFENIDFKNKFVAIKIHFGEPGNLAYLRPNWAKVVVDYVKERGGIPFLTDCNTLYVGGRKNAIEHMDTAYVNGFSPFSTDCHVIIADGLKGTDETYVKVKNGEYVKEAKIGRAIMDADIVISLNHFKGHENAGFGGAVKNLGMGSGSRAGKMEQHCDGKMSVNEKLCKNCHKCATQCAQNAISYENKVAFIDQNKCVGCGRCLGECNFHALFNGNFSANATFGKKMAEYAQAVCQDRPNFHINLVLDVSPFCDCHGDNDTPIIPNVGMFASFDPVAVDRACADKCNEQPILNNSMLTDNMCKHEDFHELFHNTNTSSDWESTLTHAEKIGLGVNDYELVTVK